MHLLRPRPGCQASPNARRPHSNRKRRWPSRSACRAISTGYPLVDLLKQRFNETHRVSLGQPVAAPVNTIAVYPHLLTPATQGQLRAANADTLYLNAWLDLSRGPVLLEVPDMAGRYYTLAFMDLYARPWHLGTRTNGGRATRYALVGPSGGAVPRATPCSACPPIRPGCLAGCW